MKKWIYRILVFGFLFIFIAMIVYAIIFAWQRLLLVFLLANILSIPVWIRAVAIRSWQPLTKKISIVVMVAISAGFSVYAFLQPSVPSSLAWLGPVAVALYFIATMVSAYFSWPGRRNESEKSLLGAQKRKSIRKNRTYVSIPFMTGSDGDASVTFINATFQKVNESKKRYPDPDFGAWIFEQIYVTKKILAERRGAFKKKSFCPSCSTELFPELREPKQIEYELKYKDFDPFVIQITIPSVICPLCGRICGIDLDGSLNNHLNEAIIAAFRSENIKP